MAKDLEFFKTLLNGFTHKIDSDRTWDKLKDKPFYEEETEVYGDTLTWDGDVEGRATTVALGMPYVKISDVVLAADDCTSGGYNKRILPDGTVQESDRLYYTESLPGFAIVGPWMVSVGEEAVGVDINNDGDAIFPESGLWTAVVQQFTIRINGYAGFKTVSKIVKPIDPKYLPEALQFGEEVQTVNEPLNITWDGNTEGLANVLDVYFKVSDAIFTDEQLKLMTFTTDNATMSPTKIGDIWDAELGKGVIPSADITVAGMICVARKDGVTLNANGVEAVFPEKGVYFAYRPNAFAVTSLTTTEPIEQTKVVTKKIDPKYLPDVGGVKYVNVVTEWDVQTDEAVYSADASYADIIGWIDAGLEVKCVFGTEIYNLVHVYPVPGIIQHSGMANSVGFFMHSNSNIVFIYILEDGYIDVYSEEIVRIDTVQTMINESLGVIENGTY